MKDFGFIVRRDAKKQTTSIEIHGDGADDLAAILEAKAQEIVDDRLASGREIIDFLTTFNDGNFSIENEEQIRTKHGDYLLGLDAKYSLETFGTLTWGEEANEFAEVFRQWRRAKVHSDPRYKSGRYPYTYACDLLRMFGPHEGISPTMSRGDASQLRSKLAKALNVADHEMAEMLANYYLENEDELVADEVARLAR